MAAVLQVRGVLGLLPAPPVAETESQCDKIRHFCHWARQIHQHKTACYDSTRHMPRSIKELFCLALILNSVTLRDNFASFCDSTRQKEAG
jgi:hypothetical protein